MLVACVAVAGNWVAAAIQKGLTLILAILTSQPPEADRWQLADWVFTVLAVGLLGWSLWALYDRRRELFGVQVLSFNLARNRPRPCLILLVSPQRFKDRKTEALRDRLQRDSQGRWFIDNPENQLTGDLRKDVECISSFALSPQWPWQQILRGLNPHLPNLRRVWLIGSGGSEGSAQELDLLAEFLRSYKLGFDVLIDPDRLRDGGLSFEDFGALTNRLRAVMNEEVRLARSKDESRIVIDVTGGPKTTSIAAASVTLNSAATFQYVQTVPNHDVLTYDIVFASRDMRD